jgi:hypothetical protein
MTTPDPAGLANAIIATSGLHKGANGTYSVFWNNMITDEQYSEKSDAIARLAELRREFIVAIDNPQAIVRSVPTKPGIYWSRDVDDVNGEWRLWDVEDDGGSLRCRIGKAVSHDLSRRQWGNEYKPSAELIAWMEERDAMPHPRRRRPILASHQFWAGVATALVGLAVVVAASGWLFG